MMHHGLGNYGGYMMQGGYWWVGLIFLAAKVILLILAVYLAVKFYRKYDGKYTSSKPTTDTAMQVLRERYARGEIDSDEYNRRKADLE